MFGSDPSNSALPVLEIVLSITNKTNKQKLYSEIHTYIIIEGLRNRIYIWKILELPRINIQLPTRIWRIWLLLLYHRDISVDISRHMYSYQCNKAVYIHIYVCIIRCGLFINSMCIGTFGIDCRPAQVFWHDIHGGSIEVIQVELL